MTYSVSWDEAIPSGTSAANQIDTFITNDKIAVRERMNDLLGTTDWATADPVKGLKLNLAGGAASSIVPGATSFAIRDSGDARNNFLVTEAGDISPYRNLNVPDGQAWVTRYTQTVAATTTVNWNNGNVQYLSMGASITSLTLSNPQAGATYLLEIKQGGSGAYTITWPASVIWAGGTAPTLTTTVGRTDIIALYYNGTSYVASVVGLDFNV